MTIVQTIQSGNEVYTGGNTNLAVKLDYPISMPANFGNPANMPCVTGLRPAMSIPGPARKAGLIYAERMRLESEMFYAPDETLIGYVSGDTGIASEITKAIRSGYGIADETGEVSLRFSKLNFFRPGFVSPLNFEQKLRNLRALYDSRIAEASGHEDEFEAALDEIINVLTEEGGAYVSSDKPGIDSSIRGIFRGETTKYSLDDIKAMVVLSRQRLIDEDIYDPNEYVLGVLLGYEASAIMALRDSGKLSDNAVKTIWGEFNSFVDNVILKATDHVEQAQKNPLRNKSRGYSPIDGQIVCDAISVMLDALQSDTYNKGIRKSLKILDESYRRHVSARIRVDILDQRYNTTTLFWHFGGPVGDFAGHYNTEWSIRSSHFARYFDLPEFALRGNLFGKNDLLAM